MTGAKGFNPYGLRIYFRNSEYQKYEMQPFPRLRGYCTDLSSAVHGMKAADSAIPKRKRDLEYSQHRKYPLPCGTLPLRGYGRAR